MQPPACVHYPPLSFRVRLECRNEAVQRARLVLTAINFLLQFLEERTLLVQQLFVVFGELLHLRGQLVEALLRAPELEREAA